MTEAEKAVARDLNRILDEKVKQLMEAGHCSPAVVLRHHQREVLTVHELQSMVLSVYTGKSWKVAPTMVHKESAFVVNGLWVCSPEFAEKAITELIKPA